LTDSDLVAKALVVVQLVEPKKWIHKAVPDREGKVVVEDQVEDHQPEVEHHPSFVPDHRRQATSNDHARSVPVSMNLVTALHLARNATSAKGVDTLANAVLMDKEQDPRSSSSKGRTEVNPIEVKAEVEVVEVIEVEAEVVVEDKANRMNAVRSITRTKIQVMQKMLQLLLVTTQTLVKHPTILYSDHIRTVFQ
jgi:hypothetical protein